MKRVIVNYGMPEDSAAFDAHYRDVHAPLTRGMPHLKGFEVSRGEVVTSDPDTPVYATAILSFASQEDSMHPWPLPKARRRSRIWPISPPVASRS